MKCHIVRNGGCLFLILCFYISTANSTISTSVYTIPEFCSGNVFIHNIEPGDSYQITLKPETASTVNKWYQKSKRRCLKEFKTSDPASHFVVLISNMTIPSCLNCRCSFFEISVLGYKKRFCGSSETEYFSSKSDKISIEFYHTNLQFDVSFTFSVERNFYIISGAPSDHDLDSGSFIETPYFPIPYPSSYRAEYRLQSDDVDSHVVLLFLDFQISSQSFIEVVGNNGTHPTRFYGGVHRPPVIVSQSYFLDIKFESNNNLLGMPGFRALSAFVKNIDSLSVPHTDCGSRNDERFGYMNIKTYETFSLYDCVWHINTNWMLPGFEKAYLSVSIQMKYISHKSILEFRDGHNSKSATVKVINCEIEDCSDLDVELTVLASSNLYIRFNGYLDAYSIVNMTYSIYHTGNCSDKEFMCDDGRCLLSDFHCDGIKQCSNGMDEEQCPTTVTPEVGVPSNPNINRGALDKTVHKKFLIIVIVGSLGLVAVLLALFLFMYKYFKAIPANIEQSQSEAIGEMSDIFGEMSDIFGDMSDIQPTLYSNNIYDNDNLPSYDDFIKSSDCYPPLLYTRAKQQTIPKNFCSECTTSFSTRTRPRYHSANSFSVRSSDTDSDIFVHNSRVVPQQTSSNCCNVEIFSNPANNTSANIRKWYSLDSKMNDLAKQDRCHVFLSVIHPVCNHASNHLTHVQYHTLPPNFKVSDVKRSNTEKFNAADWSPLASRRGITDRRCTWSFMPHTVNGSELLTVVKARCCSDPCNGFSVHYSLR